MTLEEMNKNLNSLGMMQIEFCRYLGICPNFTYRSKRGGAVSPYLAFIVNLMIENKKLREFLERANDQ